MILVNEKIMFSRLVSDSICLLKWFWYLVLLFLSCGLEWFQLVLW